MASDGPTFRAVSGTSHQTNRVRLVPLQPSCSLLVRLTLVMVGVLSVKQIAVDNWHISKLAVRNHLGDDGVGPVRHGHPAMDGPENVTQPQHGHRGGYHHQKQLAQDLQGQGGNEDDRKPFLIVHIGPPKTATSTLQFGFGQFAGGSPDGAPTSFEKDKIYFHDDGPFVSRFQRVCARGGNETRTKDECWPELRRDLWRVHLENNRSHLLYSSEQISYPLSRQTYTRRRAPIDWVGLKKHLGTDWNVVVVIGYRRYADWLPSAMQQILRWTKGKPKVNRWPDDGGARIPKPLLPDQWKSIKRLDYLTTWQILDSIRSDVRFVLFNMHDEASLTMQLPSGDDDESRHNNATGHWSPSLLSRFLCTTMKDAGVDARHSCQDSLARDRAQFEGVGAVDVVVNPHQTLFYDAMALAAREKGMVNRTLGRHHVAVEAEIFHTKHLNRTLRDFPLVCPTREDHEEFLNHSLSLEEKILPEFHHSQGYDTHVRDFWKSVGKKKYCWIDTDTLLQDENWMDFFHHL
jgi:hypothetical protein